jgi:hypothetical protein
MFGRMNERVSESEGQQTAITTSLMSHLQSCEKIARRLEKTVFGIAAGVATLIWFLLKNKIGL